MNIWILINLVFIHSWLDYQRHQCQHLLSNIFPNLKWLIILCGLTWYSNWIVWAFEDRIALAKHWLLALVRMLLKVVIAVSRAEWKMNRVKPHWFVSLMNQQRETCNSTFHFPLFQIDWFVEKVPFELKVCLTLTTVNTFIVFNYYQINLHNCKFMQSIFDYKFPI